MSFLRKKPSTPLQDLTVLYNEAANRTITNIALEEKGDLRRALQGWKGLHTHILYQFDVLNQTHNNYEFSADELYLREGIEELDSKGQAHMERVNRLLVLTEQQQRPSIPYNNGSYNQNGGNHSTYTVPTLRSTSPKGFSVRQQLQPEKPRMLKTLRTEKANRFGMPNNNSKPNDLSAVAARSLFNGGNKSQEKVNWSTSKSVSPSSARRGSTQSELNIFDKSFDDFDLSELRRSETLSQLESTANISRSTRGNNNSTGAANLIAKFDSIQLSSTSDNESPFGDSAVASSPPPPPPSSRPPIPKTKPLINSSPSIKASPSPPRITPPNSSSQQKLVPLPTANSTTPQTPTTTRKKSSTPVTPRVASNSKSNTLPRTIPVATASSIAARRTTERVTQAKRPIKTTGSIPVKTKPLSSKPTRPAPKNGTTKSMTKPTASRSNGRPSPSIHDNNSNNDEIPELSEKEKEIQKQDEIIDSIKGIDPNAAKQIFNEIVVKGDEVHWSDIAGLETAKNSLKETVVYPFLRPDLFSGLREPARGMLLFGPPGTGKTMLARAVATESRSTFFSISASSLTSKFLGESEKLVRALFLLARKLAPSIIFVDEIDSLLSARNESGEHESSRRIKNEFLIQWSELTSAAAGRETGEDLNRVLVLAATNLPWAIDEAARRRFVRRQYIPLPENDTRRAQLQNLLAHQKHTLSEEDVDELVKMTDGFSGSDITALAKDAAMGPLRSLGDKLLSTAREEIRPIGLDDFKLSLNYIRASVSKENLCEFDDWAAKFGSSGV